MYPLKSMYALTSLILKNSEADKLAQSMKVPASKHHDLSSNPGYTAETALTHTTCLSPDLRGMHRDTNKQHNKNSEF